MEKTGTPNKESCDIKLKMRQKSTVSMEMTQQDLCFKVIDSKKECRKKELHHGDQRGAWSRTGQRLDC